MKASASTRYHKCSDCHEVFECDRCTKAFRQSLELNGSRSDALWAQKCVKGGYYCDKCRKAERRRA